MMKKKVLVVSNRYLTRDGMGGNIKMVRVLKDDEVKDLKELVMEEMKIDSLDELTVNGDEWDDSDGFSIERDDGNSIWDVIEM